MLLLAASLDFLGLGVQPPTPNWGRMLADGRQYMATAWWLTVLPGLAIVVVILGVTLVGDWLRVVYDPKIGRGR
jgi:peptide/nickel transport system permease protein